MLRVCAVTNSECPFETLFLILGTYIYSCNVTHLYLESWMANKQLEAVHTAVVGKSGLRHSWCYGSTKVQLLNKMDAHVYFPAPKACWGKP